MNAIARKAALESTPEMRMMQRMRKAQLIDILMRMVSICKEQEKEIDHLESALSWERGEAQRLRNLQHGYK